MYEGEGRPDENFHKPVARDGESDNFKVPESIDYDDPRVRSIVESKGVSVEAAIMEIRAGGGVPPVETE